MPYYRAELGSPDLSNYVQKSETEGLIKNDGTIDTSKHVHLKPTKELTGEVQEKIWSGLSSFYGTNVWTDGDNIYYSSNSSQYVLDKSTSTWSTKSWSGLTNFGGDRIWTDGDNIYYSSDSSYQYILDKSTSTWNTKSWSGYTSFYGYQVQTDGDNIYYSNNRDQYVLDKSTSTWNTKTQSGLNSFRGDRIWTDGDNIYYSSSSNQYVLDKSTSTWNTKTQSGLNSFRGDYIWIDGDNIYYSNDSSYQYVLDKSTSTQNPKTQNGLTNFTGDYIWIDGDNIYYSNGSNQYVFVTEETYADGLVKSDGSIIVPDNSTITISNGVISATGGGGGVATSVIGTEETGSTASQAYTTGQYFVKDNAFCKAITDISSGTALTENTNFTKSNVASALSNNEGLYPSTETKIGTCDGKDVYRIYKKVYVTSGTTTHTTDIPSTGTILYMGGCIRYGSSDSTYEVNTIPYYNGTNSYCSLTAYINTTTYKQYINSYFTKSSTFTAYLYLVVDYTKS